MSTDSTEFQIDVTRVTRYFRLRFLLYLVLFVLLLWPVIVILVEHPQPAYFFWYSPFYLSFLAFVALTFWFPAKKASALRYWLDGSTLRIDEGVVVRKRKSIPLDRITDIAMVQGPFLRLCGIWSLQVQTAGSAQQAPEGTLLGVVEFEATRDTLMRARDSAVGGEARGGDA